MQQIEYQCNEIYKAKAHLASSYKELTGGLFVAVRHSIKLGLIILVIFLSLRYTGENHRNLHQ